MKKVLRIGSRVFDQMRKFFREGKAEDEKFCFAHGFPFKGRKKKGFILSDLFPPEREEMEKQSPSMVSPKKDYQIAIYGLAEERGCSVFDIHTHPFQQSARFSSIDQSEGRMNAGFFEEKIDPRTTMAMIVFNRDLDHFDAQFWDRWKKRFEKIDEIEILGHRTEIIHREKRTVAAGDERFSRHTLIPGFNQKLIEELDVAVVGLGGNGAAIVTNLASLGVGRRGTLFGCDPDDCELSNLSRIGFMTPSDVGKPKAEVVERYCRDRFPDFNFEFMAKDVRDPEVRGHLIDSHLMVLAVDRDRPREDVNRLAVQYGIPVLNLAAEIIPMEEGSEEGAQVTVVEPGVSSCLVCSGLIDLSTLDVSDVCEEERESLAQIGYIRGNPEVATPSVVDLNQMAASLATAQIAAMTSNRSLEGREFLFYDRVKMSLVAASLPPWDENCPICGLQGVACRGDVDPSASLSEKLGSTKAPSEPESSQTSLKLRDGKLIERADALSTLEPSADSACEKGDSEGD